MKRIPVRLRAPATALAVLFALSSLTVWWFRRESALARRAATVELRAASNRLLSVIESHLHERFNDAALLAQIGELSPRERRLSQLNSTASGVVSRENSYYRINYVDTGSVCRLAVPDDMPGSPLGKKLTNLSGRKQFHDSVRTVLQPVCSPVMTLLSERQGMVIWFPLVDRRDSLRVFDGMIAATFHIDELIRNALRRAHEKGYSFSIGIDGNPVAQVPPSGPGLAPAAQGRRFAPGGKPAEVVTSRDILGRRWKVRVVGSPPEVAELMASSALVGSMALIFNILLAFLTFFLVRGNTKLKVVQVRLRASEANYHAIFDAVNDAIFVHELDTLRVMQVNRRAAELFGFDQEEMKRTTPDQTCAGYSPFTAEHVFELGKRASRGEKLVFEWHARRKNGETFWVEVNLCRATVAGVERVVATVRDITERKQSEIELKRHTDFIQATLDNMPIGIVVSEMKSGRARYMNDRLLQIHGWPREEISESEAFLSKVFADPAQREEFRLKTAADIESGDRARMHWDNFPIATASGETRQVSVTAIPLAEQGITIFAAQDVTAQIQAEQSLRRSEQRYRAVVEAQTEFIVRWKPDTSCTFVNAACCTFFGKTPEELIGTSFLSLIAEEDRERVYALVRRMTPDHPEEISEWRGLRADGTVAWLRWTDRAIFEESGSISELQSVGRDVTAERRAHQERAQLEEQLRQSQKLEAIGQLAGGVAHDFNNLLAAIIGYSDMVLRGLPQDTTVHSDVRMIQQAGKRAATLIQQLLAFSRKQTLSVRQLDLNQSVRDLEKMLRRVIGEDVELATSLEPEIGHIKGDAGQIDQIIMNLAVNSRDAMPSGGKLAIETSDIFLDEQYASLHADVKPGPYVMLAVSDNGCGMNSETLRRAFEPFFTTKGPGKGTGLGLATVYGIVKQHGGHLDARSEPGTGTTFRIYFPRIEIAHDPGESPEGKEYTLGRGEAILVVEDDPVVLKLTARLLARAGYRVITAGDENEARAIFTEHKSSIELLLTDVIMPGKSGKEVFLALRELEPDLRVLFMSGYADTALSQHGVLGEGIHLLQKPFTAAELTAKVRQALGSGSGRDADDDA